MARRHYSNPPLIEALCQFQLKPSQAWDLAIPGLLYAEIKDEYPLRRQREAVEFLIRGDLQAVRQSRPPQRMQFLSSDKRSLVQVGPDLLVINSLSPYPRWEVFRDRIIRAARSYREVLGGLDIETIALRYINRIEIGEPVALIEDYLLVMPHIPETIPQTFLGWAQTVDIPFEDRGTLRLKTGSQEKGEGALAFILDLELTSFEVEPGTDEAKIFAWVEAAHSRIEEVFEACITEKSRQLFGEVES
jgi:uncharacterized protein (TIGR04255 family)